MQCTQCKWYWAILYLISRDNIHTKKSGSTCNMFLIIKEIVTEKSKACPGWFVCSWQNMTTLANFRQHRWIQSGWIECMCVIRISETCKIKQWFNASVHFSGSRCNTNIRHWTLLWVSEYYLKQEYVQPNWPICPLLGLSSTISTWFVSGWNCFFLLIPPLLEASINPLLQDVFYEIKRTKVKHYNFRWGQYHDLVHGWYQ